MRAATRRRLRFFISVLGIIATGGALLGSVLGRTSLIGTLVSALDAVLVLGTIVAVEIFLPQTRFGRTLERAPFLATFVVKWLAYYALIVIEIGGRVGRHLVTAVLIGGDPMRVVAQQPPRVPLRVAMMILALFVPFVILVIQLSRLMGERTLRDIVLGRYHRPRAEERFFLFVDIAGSTPLAERIGPAGAHRFLGRVFQVASAPIDDCRGEIYQYVGDEIVITWTASEGRQGARPLACFFGIEQALTRAAQDFDRDFGVVPRLRAALHAGPVVTGEVGESRRAIVFHGDVMNTTARIEGVTRDLERQFLVSADALQRLDSVAGFALEDLGLQPPRGRAEPVRVYSVAAQH
jgi:adenylate cyclase